MQPTPSLAELAAANAEAGPRIPSTLEFISVWVFFAACAAVAARAVVLFSEQTAVWTASAVLAGYVLSDFVSGLVHWTFDTWGSPDTPVVGKTFIVPFRIHHVDEKDITRHGFVATNGHNCLASLAVLIPALLVPLPARWAAPILSLLLSMCLGVFATNQFHKWAHCDQVSAPIRWLQQSRLILGPRHHDIHHTPPYAEHYCITSGWLNRLLGATHFFRLLERTIVKTTGAAPRRDDLVRTGVTP